MLVEYIDHMGDDERVIRAARVSHKSDTIGDVDRLLRYLADGITAAEKAELFDEIVAASTTADADRLWRRIKNIQQHFAPFCHCIVSLRVTAPLAIARQLWKSHIGLSSQDDTLAWSEMSMRYVRPDASYQPEMRSKAENVKQGSAGEIVVGASNIFVDAAEYAADAYDWLIQSGVAPESARFVLPMATETTWYWTGSVLAFSRIHKLRIDPHAQRESQEIARQIEAVVEPLFPRVWRALL